MCMSHLWKRFFLPLRRRGNLWPRQKRRRRNPCGSGCRDRWTLFYVQRNIDVLQYYIEVLYQIKSVRRNNWKFGNLEALFIKVRCLLNGSSTICIREHQHPYRRRDLRTGRLRRPN